MPFLSGFDGKASSIDLKRKPSRRTLKSAVFSPVSMLQP